MRLAVLLLALCLAAPLSAQGWPTTTWQASCLADADLSDPDCDADSPTSPLAYMEATLAEASAWLEGLGFAEPILDRGAEPPHPYLIGVGEDSLFVAGRHVIGYYAPYETGNATSPYSGTMTVNRVHLIQIEGEADKSLSVIHEVVHSVQPIAFNRRASPETYWIHEGTAQAVAEAWLRDIAGGTDEPRYGYRTFSAPLHDPETFRHAYSTAEFWLGIGELIGAPNRVGYLADFYDRLSASGSVETDIGVLDEVLRSQHPHGLYDLYPAFIARYASRPDQYAPEAGIEIGGDDEKDITAGVHALATNRHVVRLTDIDSPTKVTLTIEDDPSLHLIVGDSRYDLVDPTDRDASRNRAVVVTSRPDTLVVRVAQIAPDLAVNGTTVYTLRVKTEPLAQCDEEPEGLGAVACMDVAGPQMTGVMTFETPLVRRSSIMGLGAMMQFTSFSEKSGTTLRGAPFFDVGPTTVVITHTGTERRLFNLQVFPNGKAVVVFTHPVFDAVGLEDVQWTLTESDAGSVLQGRFSGTFGGCSPSSGARPSCVRNMRTNEVIEAHRVRGSVSVRLPSE